MLSEMYCDKYVTRLVTSGGVVARGRRWTAREDRAIYCAAKQTRYDGISARGRHRKKGSHRARLREVAEKLGRTYGAVRMRAHRIDERSYECRDTDDE